MTKVTYNKYSCVLSDMSREMMKFDGRDSAECQNWEKREKNWHYRSCFKSLKDKKWNSACPLQNENEPKRGG